MVKYAALIFFLFITFVNRAGLLFGSSKQGQLKLDPIESWQGQSPSSKDILIGIRYADKLKVKEIKLNDRTYKGEFNFDGEVLKLIKVKNDKSLRRGANFLEVTWNDGESFITVVRRNLPKVNEEL